MSQQKGKFIVIEGVDGCGKGTLMEHLKNVLPTNQFVFTREPGGTPFGAELRKLLLNNEIDPVTQLLLFEADRKRHIEEVILPALASGKHVISDRFDASTFAYQAETEKLQKFFLMVNEFVIKDCRPDQYIFLDLPIEVSMERTRTRGENTNVFENKPMAYFEGVRMRYGFFFEEVPVHFINAEAKRELVAGQAEELIRVMCRQ